MLTRRKWARGGKAKFVCDRCGFTYPYKTRRYELSGLGVCSDCYDVYQPLNHPANKPNPIPPDAPLKDPQGPGDVYEEALPVPDNFQDLPSWTTYRENV